MGHHFFPSFGEAAEFISEQANSAYEIYHACAVYRTADSRKASNVLCLRALLADVDTNEGCQQRLDGRHLPKERTYATIIEAVLAVRGFCQKYRIPYPLIVVSGYGLHLYWPLTIALTVEQWLPYARALKAAMVEYGLLFDPGRTSDAASVLRPVGTWNHKYSTHPSVELRFDPGVDYPLSAFDHLINEAAHAKIHKETSSSASVLHLPQGTGRSLTGASSYFARVTTEDFRSIVEGCQQLVRFSASGGCVSEPEWFFAAGVAAPCGPIGFEWFHRISSQKFEAYDYNETETKLARKAAETTGPTTCATYQRDFPAGCRGCKFAGKIKTPLDIPQAARFIAPPPPVLSDVQKAMKLLPREPLDGFCYDDTGALTALLANSRGAVQSVTVCSYPMFLREILQREDDGTEQALLSQYRDRHWQDIPIDYPTILGRAPADNLAKLGVNIQAPLSNFRSYITARTEQLRQIGRPVTKLYTSFGYKDDQTRFLWGNRLYSDRGVERAPVAPELKAYEAAFEIPRTADLQSWKRAIAPFFFKDFTYVHALTILAAFGSVLMPLVMDEAEGGCAICLSGAEGGGGKTTAVIAGTSAFYFYKSADIFGRDTANAMWGLVSSLRNLPIVWDDLRVPKGNEEILFEMLENFNHGRDKRRMQANGDLRRVSAGWQTMMLITTNASLRMLMSALARREEKARTHRVMEFEAPANDDYFRSDVGGKLRAAYYAHRCVAGDWFLRTLFSPGVIKDIKEKLSSVHTGLIEFSHWPASARYWLQALAAIQVAGDLAFDAGFIPKRPNEIVSWAIDYQTGILKEDHERSQTVHDRARLMLSSIRSDLILDTLIVEQSRLDANTFNVMNEPRGVPTARLEDGCLLVIRLDKFKQIGYCAAGANLKRYLEALKTAGVYVGEEEIDIGRGTRYSSGAVECHVFDVRSFAAKKEATPVHQGLH